MRYLSMIAVLGAAALPLAGCDCSGPIETNDCTVDGDCPSGERCLDSRCQPDEGPGLDGGSGLDSSTMGPPDTGPRPDRGGPDPGPCGDFDPFCDIGGVGAGTERPFDLDDDPNEGVDIDDDGALILGSRRIDTQFIWIADTAAGLVSKVDTRTFEEVARYATGPELGAGWHAGNDPSRTSVNTAGDVFVANRDRNSVLRISVLEGECPDRDGDGVVRTSSGAGDLLDWGDDECVLWETSLAEAMPGEDLLRAVAAQDVEGLDGEITEYVWVGGHRTRRVAKLDGRTGEVLFVTDSPVPPYGFALDGAGILWIAWQGGNNSGEPPFSLGRLNTNTCLDAASCGEGFCTAPDPESDACDGEPKARIPSGARGSYGITVDFNQRVWAGGWRNGANFRYDPGAMPGSRWATMSGEHTTQCNGVGADARGFVYFACQSASRMLRVDGDTLEYVSLEAGPIRGIGIDADGRVWGVRAARESGGTAMLLTPGAAIDDNAMERVGPDLEQPYTYSDMTGLQLRLATNPRGHYRTVFEGCPEGEPTAWQELRFDAEVPPGTSVSFRARTADTRAGLDDATWVSLANLPPDASPTDVAAALVDAGIEPGRFLMLEVVLRSDRSSPTEVITPRVLSMEVTHTCEPILS